jgi:hypothetical protein
MAIGSTTKERTLPMTDSAYKRISRIYPSAVATVALVVALVGVPGVTAGGLLVTSKNVKNDSITSADIRKATLKTSDIGTNAVRSADIKAGAVESADIGTDQVTPVDVAMPDPEQLQRDDTASVKVGTDYARIYDAGSFLKEDPMSAVQISWTGTAAAPSVSCTFQIRIDGVPSPGNAGAVFVQVGNSTSLAASALFLGLAPGPHSVEVWARSQTIPGGSDPCVVGPSEAGLPQSFVITEEVL